MLSAARFTSRLLESRSDLLARRSFSSILQNVSVRMLSLLHAHAARPQNMFCSFRPTASQYKISVNCPDHKINKKTKFLVQ